MGQQAKKRSERKLAALRGGEQKSYRVHITEREAFVLAGYFMSARVDDQGTQTKMARVQTRLGIQPLTEFLLTKDGKDKSIWDFETDVIWETPEIDKETLDMAIELCVPNEKRPASGIASPVLLDLQERFKDVLRGAYTAPELDEDDAEPLENASTEPASVEASGDGTQAA